MLRSLGSALIVAASLCASPMFAADMPTKAAPVYTEPASKMWAGFYIGGHVGYGFGEIKPDFGQDIVGKLDTKGLIGGGQVGYNWQYSNVVAGVEVDATWLNAKDDLNSIICEGPCGVSGKFDFIGSARARVGLANGGWLFYGTGGLAWGHTAISGEGQTFGSTVFGWAGGFGIEAMLSQHWTARVEFLHYNFGTDTLAGQIPVKNTMNVGRVGLNFKF